MAVSVCGFSRMPATIQSVLVVCWVWLAAVRLVFVYICVGLSYAQLTWVSLCLSPHSLC